MFSVIFWVVLVLSSVSSDEEDSDPETKILGGRTVSMSSFPYIVSLQINNIHACGGTIINSRWIVTAAHCSPVTHAIAGNPISNTIGGQRMTLIRKITHPGFIASSSLPNDIMLAKTDYPLRYTSTVQPARLGGIGLSERAFVIGWGRTTNEDTDATRRRSLKGVSIVTTQCTQRYDNNRLKICAASPPGIDSCGGDSGGPLVRSFNGAVVGITSYGTTTCGIGAPAVYTRIEPNIPWITSIINSS